MLQQYEKPLSEVTIISDLDGTLLTRDHKLSDENRNALNEFIKLGGNFTFATGRFIQSAKLLNIPITMPAILCNGSVIYDFSLNRVLWNKALDDSIISLVRELLDVFPGIGIEVITFAGTYLISYNEAVKIHIDLDGLEPFPWTDKALEDIPESWQKVTVGWDSNKLAKVNAFLEEKKLTLDFPFQFAISHPVLMDINDENSNKGFALDELCKLCSISIDKTMAIGDNQNDLDLIKNAGIGIAVANAQDIVKNNADHICLNNSQHIMVDILNNLKKNKNYYSKRS